MARRKKNGVFNKMSILGEKWMPGVFYIEVYKEINNGIS